MYFWQKRFHADDHLRPWLLDEIGRAQSDRVSGNHWGDQISRTDFFRSQPSDYTQELRPHLEDHITRTLLVPRVQITEIWFQQYSPGDQHSWHTHEDSHFTSVYFLELADPHHQTEIRLFGTEILHEYQAREGDIITFPSFLSHRSPEITTDQNKTVISFNARIMS